MTSTSRRRFVSTVLRAGVGAAVLPTPALAELASRLAPQTSSSSPTGSTGSTGARLAVIPFVGEGAAAVGEITGVSHQGRLAFDLATVTGRYADHPERGLLHPHPVPGRLAARGRRALVDPDRWPGARAAHAPGRWARRTSGAAGHGAARVLWERAPAGVRLAERGRVVGRPVGAGARTCPDARLRNPCADLRRRSSFERRGAVGRGELGVHVRSTRSHRCVPRHPDERRAAAARPRRAGAPPDARLVRLHDGEVGRGNPAGRGRRAGDRADEGIRRADTPGRCAGAGA